VTVTVVLGLRRTGRRVRRERRTSFVMRRGSRRREERDSEEPGGGCEEERGEVIEVEEKGVEGEVSREEEGKVGPEIRMRMAPTWEVTYWGGRGGEDFRVSFEVSRLTSWSQDRKRKERLTFQLKLPTKNVAQNTSHLTPTTPHATFIPLQGTSPVALITSSFLHAPLPTCCPPAFVDSECDEEVEGGAAMDARTTASCVGKSREMRGESGRERR
jgi:hypothetical protein